MALSAERRAALLATKLSALVRPLVGEGDFAPGAFGAGAAALGGGQAWVLLDERPERGLGPALAWAEQQPVAALNVLSDSATGVLARRAGWFVDPPRVWRVEGRNVVAAEIEPLPAPSPSPADLDEWVTRIEAAGADAVLEHGVLTGEVLGLEVCRLVTDPIEGRPRLEVGVGAHDREAFQILHGDIPPLEALRDVVTKVAALRAAVEPPHALRRLAGERLLRSHLLTEPERVGTLALAAAPPPIPRENVKDAVPCVASGIGVDGQPVVVVCSVGIDLDVVPFAADARAALGDDKARLVIAVPARDSHPITHRLAARLRVPAEVLALD